MKTALRCAVVLALAAAAGPAAAHHSFAMYDSKQMKLTGTVTEFEWSNPHVYISLETVDASGAQKNWTIECANPGILDRAGWKFNMVKVGDKLVLIVAPLHSGEAGALLKEITLPDGRVFNNGAAAGPATIH